MAITPEMHVASSQSEDAHQKAIFAAVALDKTKYPSEIFKYLFFACPNGGDRDIVSASKMKATGQKSGVSDMILLYPRGEFHYLTLELKRPIFRGKKNGGCSDKQLEFGASVLAVGGAFAVAYGWEEAITFIDRYMALGEYVGTKNTN